MSAGTATQGSPPSGDSGAASVAAPAPAVSGAGATGAAGAVPAGMARPAPCPQATPVASNAATRGDFISLECWPAGTTGPSTATVMLAQGLLVVRHLGGQCNVYSLATATDVNLESAESLGSIPWGKAAYLYEKRQRLPGWGESGDLWGVKIMFQRDLDPSIDWSRWNMLKWGAHLLEPQPLPFIFRRLPLGCRLLARRVRLLAVLLSQHPRVGSARPAACNI